MSNTILSKPQFIAQVAGHKLPHWEVEVVKSRGGKQKKYTYYFTDNDQEKHMFSTQSAAYTFYRDSHHPVQKREAEKPQEAYDGDDSNDATKSDSERACDHLNNFLNLMGELEKFLLTDTGEGQTEESQGYLAIRKIAQDALQSLQENEVTQYRTLILTGETSSGKSFLLNVLFHLFATNKWDYTHKCKEFYGKDCELHYHEAVTDAARSLLNMYNQGYDISSYFPQIVTDDQIQLLDEASLLLAIQSVLSQAVHTFKPPKKPKNAKEKEEYDRFNAQRQAEKADLEHIISQCEQHTTDQREFLLPSQGVGPTTPFPITCRYGRTYQVCAVYFTKEELFSFLSDPSDESNVVQSQREILCAISGKGTKETPVDWDYNEFPKSRDELKICEEVAPLVGTVQIYAGAGNSALDDRVYVREQLKRITGRKEEDETWRSAYAIKEVLVYVPALILEGNVEIKDIAGTSDLNGTRYCSTSQILETAQLAMLILAGARTVASAKSDFELLKQYFLPRLLMNPSKVKLSLLFTDEQRDKPVSSTPEAGLQAMSKKAILKQNQSKGALKNILQEVQRNLREMDNNNNNMVPNLDVDNLISFITYYPSLFNASVHKNSDYESGDDEKISKLIAFSNGQEVVAKMAVMLHSQVLEALEYFNSALPRLRQIQESLINVVLPAAVLEKAAKYASASQSPYRTLYKKTILPKFKPIPTFLDTAEFNEIWKVLLDKLVVRGPTVAEKLIAYIQQKKFKTVKEVLLRLQPHYRGSFDTNFNIANILMPAVVYEDLSKTFDSLLAKIKKRNKQFSDEFCNFINGSAMLIFEGFESDPALNNIIEMYTTNNIKVLLEQCMLPLEETVKEVSTSAIRGSLEGYMQSFLKGVCRAQNFDSLYQIIRTKLPEVYKDTYERIHHDFVITTRQEEAELTGRLTQHLAAKKPSLITRGLSGMLQFIRVLKKPHENSPVLLKLDSFQKSFSAFWNDLVKKKGEAAAGQECMEWCRRQRLSESLLIREGDHQEAGEPFERPKSKDTINGGICLQNLGHLIPNISTEVLIPPNTKISVVGNVVECLANQVNLPVPRMTARFAYFLLKHMKYDTILVEKMAKQPDTLSLQESFQILKAFCSATRKNIKIYVSPHCKPYLILGQKTHPAALAVGVKLEGEQYKFVSFWRIQNFRLSAEVEVREFEADGTLNPVSKKRALQDETEQHESKRVRANTQNTKSTSNNNNSSNKSNNNISTTSNNNNNYNNYNNNNNNNNNSSNNNNNNYDKGNSSPYRAPDNSDNKEKSRRKLYDRNSNNFSNSPRRDSGTQHETKNENTDNTRRNSFDNSNNNNRSASPHRRPESPHSEKNANPKYDYKNRSNSPHRRPESPHNKNANAKYDDKNRSNSPHRRPESPHTKNANPKYDEKNRSKSPESPYDTRRSTNDKNKDRNTRRDSSDNSNSKNNTKSPHKR